MNGVCTSCARDYQFYNGLCIQVKRCGDREYMGDNGYCIQVSNFCTTFNPTSGKCTGCIQTFNLANGFCCQSGLVASISGICAPFSLIQSNLDSSSQCRTYHPTFGYCLSCNPGYQLANGAYGTCIQL